jgi:hypothetical protein
VAYGAGVLGRGSHALFGAPEAVAAIHTLTGKAHAHMASWLRVGEAMLRRLLVIEAAAYPKPNTRPLLHAPRKRVRIAIRNPNSFALLPTSR